MKQFRSVFFILFIFSSSINLLKAGVETVNNRISGSAVINSASVFVQDLNYPNTELSGGAKVANSSSQVIFSFDNASNLYFSASNTVKLGLKLYSFDKTGTAQSIPGIIELVIGYSPTGTYKDKSVYVVNGSHRILAVIQYIRDGSNVTIPPASIPQNLSLEVEQTTERYYSFSTASSPSFKGSTFISASNELDVYWNTVAGAEEYELEWTYVNDYDASGAAMATTAVFCNFRGNSTRVRVTQNHYPISLVFDQGYIVYRIRAIGKPFSDLSKELFGVWTAAESGMISTYTGSTSYYYISSSTRHERTKNWQYSASYAEEGKKKEVVAYFDGSLRNRQSVTKINTDKKTIVGETIYDFQGRGAVQTLPVPTAQSVIKFYPDFNKSDASGNYYDKVDFDKDVPASSCVSQVFGMSTTTGSSYYYSSANTDKNGFQSYVPDANKYPFSQIEYTPDNTGRIRRQSGVGPDHTLGSTHETQYFYGQPEQIQLDRMFGSEVGDFKHYKKNMVIDANGQVSVSYLDMHGRTIATSLAGTSPTNLSPLTGAVSTELNVQFLSATDPLVPNTNVFQDNALIFTKELLVATAGDYDFYYDLAVPQFTDACLPFPICYDCVYDLELSIKDACGVLVGPTVTQKIGTLVDGSLDAVCGSPITFSITPSPTTVNLPVGSYTIYKKLKINEAAIDFYAANYLANATAACVTPYATFLANALALVDTSACDITCAECVASLGLYTSHNDSTKSDPINFASTYDANYIFYTITEWKRVIAECNAPCEPANLCEAQYQTILSDVSPNGQYAKYTIDGSGAASSTDPLSVFNMTNSLPERYYASPNHSDWRNPKWTAKGSGNINFYYELDGSKSVIVVVPDPSGGYIPAVASGVTPMGTPGNEFIYPQELANLTDFINEFGNHSEWAKSLVEYHPEYPYYAWCINNSNLAYSYNTVSSVKYTSDSFDDKLRAQDDYDDAITDGLLSLTSISDLLDQDPYFNTSSSSPSVGPNNGQGWTQKAAMLAKLTNYNSATNPSLKVLCSRVTKCGTTYYGSLPGPCDDIFTTGSTGTIVEEDQAWVLYRNIYLAEKQKFQQIAANSYAIGQNNYNGCIGVGTGVYNPWTFGSSFGSFSWMFTTTNPDPCGYTTWFLYKDKVKRFQNGADAQDGVDPFGNPQTAFDALVGNTDYNVYLQTGQCPVTNDLGGLLDNLAHASALITATGDLLPNGLFTKKLYDAISSTPTPFIHYYYTSSVGGGNTLSILFRPNSLGATPVCTTSIVLPGGHSWSNVVRFTTINYTNESPTGFFNFTITAYIDTNPADAIPAIQVTCTGSTCINLSSCTFPDQCGPSEMALNLQNLFNALNANGELDNTNVDLAVAPYDNLYVNNIVGVTYSSIKWNWISSNYGKINYTPTGGSAAYCGFDFAFVNSGYVMSNINYFANVQPHATDPTKFLIDAWVGGTGGHFEPMIVTNTEGCFIYKECTPPPNLACTGPEYENNEGLLDALNTMAFQGKLLTDFALTSLPDFAALMGFPTSNNWNYFSVNTTTKEYFAGIDDGGIDVCDFHLQYSDLANTHAYSDITGFFDLRVYSSAGPPPIHDFTIMARFSDGTTLKLFGSISCLTLAVCEQCTEYAVVSNLYTYNFDSYTAGDFMSSRTYSAACTMNNSSYTIRGPGHCSSSIPDHNNPGVGNFMACNSDHSTNLVIWDKTVTGIVPNTYYKFTYWALRGNAIVNPERPYWTGNALQTNVDGVIANAVPLPYTPGVWTEESTVWFSGAAVSGSVNLQIIWNVKVGTIGIDDIKFDIVTPTPCTPTPADPDSLVLPYVNPCVQNLINLATSNATYAYNSYIDGVEAEFRADYIEVCKNALENFRMVYDDKEYHITLYYYDQAGNLVKTVPPEGVVLVTAPADLTQVATDRMNKTQTYVTTHALKTHYEYNSLNQLIRQATPDNGLLNKWLLNGVSLIPATTNVYGMAFSSGTNGFVVGDDGSGLGVIYITSDGGATWSLVSNLGVGDLQDVQFVSSSVGYAITEAGYLVGTVNSGTTWTVINTGTTQKLTDLYFSSSSTGTIIGENGTILNTTTSGATWTAPTSVTTAFSTANFNDLHFINSSEGFIAGNNATVIRTTDGGVTWTDLPGVVAGLNVLIDLNAVYFSSSTVGYVAGINNFGIAKAFMAKAVITGSGTITNWTISTPIPSGTGVELNAIEAIATTPNATIYAGGTGGKLYSTTDLVSFTTHTISGFTSEITELTFPKGGTNLIGYATAKNGKVLRQANASGTASWSELAVGTSTAPLNGLYFTSGISTDGYVAGDGGALYKTTNSGTSWTSLTNVVLPVLNDACFAPADPMVAYAVGNAGGVVKSIDGGATWGPVTHAFTSNAMYGVALLDNATGFAVGNAGATLTISGGGVTATNSYGAQTFNDIALVTATPTVRYIAVGNAGTVYKNVSGTWTSQTSGTANALNAVYFVGNTGFAVGAAGTVIKMVLNPTTSVYTFSTLTTPAACSSAVFREVYFRDNLTGYVMGSGGVIIKTVDGGLNWIIETGTNSGNFYAAHFNDDGQAILAGTTAGGATTNMSTLDDESNDYSSRFWYDRLGRMIVSQNGKQFNKSPKAYSYTKYDALGRIIELGETGTATDVGTLANVHGVIGSDVAFAAWLAAGTRTEITSTLYDIAVSPVVPGLTQQNLRTRVSASFIDEDGTGGYEAGSIYSYDVHGNVKTLVQDFASNAITYPTQRYKRMDYTYDLVSGKVNQVSYQAGQADQMYHKYEYDANNRITVASTSNDAVIWNKDASYFYYQHGPLARVELGDQKVQATDYVYNLQGWLKGVNSNTLDETRDPGKDGTTGTLYTGYSTDIHSKIAKDAYGYSLSYYDAATTPVVNGNDYTAINTTMNTVANDFEADASASPGYTSDAPNLFNGNIKRMVTTIVDIDPSSGSFGQVQPQLTAYRYDQLNRIVRMKAYNDLTVGTNVFGNGTQFNRNGTLVTHDSAYRSTMAYDANGNITDMKANGKSGSGTIAMDDMHYNYDIDAVTGKKRSNKLYLVDDAAVTSPYANDIDDQGVFVPAVTNNLDLVNTANNYSYDEIGNLVKDDDEDIASITWTVYGKIKTITREATSSAPDLVFTYDSQGNRITKLEKTKSAPGVLNASIDWVSTGYVRDGSGNVMATYKKEAATTDITLNEQNLYGSSRLGNDVRNLNLTTPPSPTPNYYSRTVGRKQFELSNHLGNVLTSVSDRKIAVQSVGVPGTIDYYISDILFTQDYYSYGMPLQGRGYAGANGYRYGFNGKEQDKEVSGSGNSYDYGFRIYNPRLGRFLSVDPLTKDYPMLTPYQFASNSPIDGIDIDGLEYLSANEVRIKMINGQVHLNLENCHTTTQGAWRQRNMQITLGQIKQPEGSIGGFSTEMAQISFQGLVKHPTDPDAIGAMDLDKADYTPDVNTSNNQSFNYTKIGGGVNKKDGTPDMRYNVNKVNAKQGGVQSATPSANGRLGGLAAVLNLVTWGLEQATIFGTADDQTMANEHMSLLKDKVTKDLNKALNSGMIPAKYQNGADLAAIASVILSGTNPTKDQKIYDIGIEIVKKVSGNYKAPMTTVSMSKPSTDLNQVDGTNTGKTVNIPTAEYQKK